MANENQMTIDASGMLGGTYLCDSPIVVEFYNMVWPTGSSVHMLVAEVTTEWDSGEAALRTAYMATLNSIVGQNPDRRWAGYIARLGAETLPGERTFTYSFLVADMTEYNLDIRTAYQSFYFDYDFHRDVIMANAVVAFLPSTPVTIARSPILGTFQVTMSYIDSIGNKGHQTFQNFPASHVFQGYFTEMQRLIRAEQGAASLAADIDPVTNTAPATTKPAEPEFIGADSLFVVSRFEGSASVGDDSEEEVVPNLVTRMISKNCNEATPYGRTVVRDSSRRYTDFLFVNSRGALESCSGVALESLEISAATKHYQHVQGASFSPERPLFSVAEGGVRSWDMSSGHVTRPWAEWWVLEFLRSNRWWMRIGDRYLPVTVSPAKKNVSIYDRQKQKLAHVDFTVTLAYDG